MAIFFSKKGTCQNFGGVNTPPTPRSRRPWHTFRFLCSRQFSKKLTAHLSLYFVDLGTASPIFVWISTSDIGLAKRFSLFRVSYFFAFISRNIQ